VVVRQLGISIAIADRGFLSCSVQGVGFNAIDGLVAVMTVSIVDKPKS
jgi:hypothetical protein